MAKSKPPSPYGYGPSAWRLIGRGIELGLIIGGLTFLGHLADQWWGTEHWLALTGALLATVGGSYNLAKDVLFPRKPTPDGDRPEGQDSRPGKTS